MPASPAPDVMGQPPVADAVSDTAAEIMGEAVRRARLAAGATGPAGFACSVGAAFQVE